MSVLDRILEARAAGRLDALCDLVPFSRFLGLRVGLDGDQVLLELPFAEHLIGNPGVPAIHGGAIGALLESAAIFQVLWAQEVVTVPKTINLTIDYRRPARTTTTWAAAQVTKRGRRVVNLAVEAWQDDPERPVATALVHLLVRTAD